jgi:elongation factor G
VKGMSSRRMAAVAPSNRRNFGLVAHVDAGKTTCTERILFFTGRSHKIGEVHDGAAQMDYLDEERKRGITITAAATFCEWKDHRMSLIDTPGHIDFTVEVERSLRVLDGAIGVFCAVGGVEPQSETVWRQADRYGVPRLAFINKMDRGGAEFESVLKQIRKKLYGNPVPINVPVGEGPDFRGILDIVHECAYEFVDDGKGGTTMKLMELDDKMKEDLEKYREQLFEAISNFDEQVMEAYLEGDAHGVPLPLVKQAIRRGTLEMEITPALCGSALRNMGVRLLLDAIVDYLPAPEDHPAIEGTDPETGEELLRARSPKAPVAALAFKNVAEVAGEMTFIRLYSGTATPDTEVYNPRTKRSTRMGRMVRVHANRKEPIEKAEAGAIFAVQGMKDVATGDTLCDERHAIQLEAPIFPEPVITVTVEPVKNADRDKLAKALSRLAREDPSFRRVTDEVTGETLIGGMGELHLEVCLNRIRDDFKVGVNTGKPQVAYRQILKKECRIESRYIKQSGGSGQYAVAVLEFTPNPEVDGLEFIDETKGGVISNEFIPSIERGLREEMAEGGELRFPIVGITARLVDGKTHPVDSSDRAFQACARQAMRMAADQIGFGLLEPLLKFHVSAPEASQGSVMGDLNNRRGEVREFETEKGIARMSGLIPAAETFAYNSGLMTMTQGQGSFSFEPSEYGRVPQSIAEEVRKARKESLDEKKK